MGLKLSLYTHNVNVTVEQTYSFIIKTIICLGGCIKYICVIIFMGCIWLQHLCQWLIEGRWVLTAIYQIFIIFMH